MVAQFPRKARGGGLYQGAGGGEGGDRVSHVLLSLGNSRPYWGKQRAPNNAKTLPRECGDLRKSLMKRRNHSKPPVLNPHILTAPTKETREAGVRTKKFQTRCVK